MLLFLREKKCLVLYIITLFSLDEFDQIPVRQNQNKCQKSPQPHGLEACDLLSRLLNSVASRAGFEPVLPP